jgi:hypothetical protein
MNANSKKTVKAAAVAVGLVAVLLLPTGCYAYGVSGIGGGEPAGQQAPASADTVVAPPTVD